MSRTTIAAWPPSKGSFRTNSKASQVDSYCVLIGDLHIAPGWNTSYKKALDYEKMRRINRIQSYAILICAIQLLSSVTYEYVLNKSSKVHISSAFESLRTGEIRYKQNENKQAGLYETIVVSALDSCYRAKWGQDAVSNWRSHLPLSTCAAVSASICERPICDSSKYFRVLVFRHVCYWAPCHGTQLWICLKCASIKAILRNSCLELYLHVLPRDF